MYAKNPLLAMFPKNESPDGFAGKYIPVPLEYAGDGVFKLGKIGGCCDANTEVIDRCKNLRHRRA